MGRKIPGRKHRGVRDPEKQQAERWNNIKDKVNAPPANADDQQVSKSLSRIIELKNKVKSGDFDKKPKKKPQKKTPVFRQYQDETDKAFLYRVNKLCEQATKEAQFEDKYKVNIKRNVETGEVEDVVKRPKDELEVYLKQAKREQNDKKTKKKKKKMTKEEEERSKMSKSQKWQLKKKEKLQKKKGEVFLDFDSYKDPVQFGETVHAPPTLSAPKKVEKLGIAARPGRNDLLLKSLLPSGKNSLPKLGTDSKKKLTFKQKLDKVGNKAINRKGKRKDLPNALRRQLDTQQKEVIEAYKLIKRKK